jgi:hypothetical protein
MSTSEILTLVLAAYAAILSTILGIAQLGRERRRVKVNCRLAVSATPGGKSAEFISIQAVNMGQRPVEVHMAGLLMNNGRTFTQVASRIGPIPLPRKLQDGESVTILIDLDKAKLAVRDADIQGLRYTAAIVRDAEGREYSAGVPSELHPLPGIFSAA